MNEKKRFSRALLLWTCLSGAFLSAQERIAQERIAQERIAQNQDQGLAPVQIWRAALPGVNTAPPVPGAETIALICEGGVLACYSTSGTPLWNFSAGGRLVRFISRSPEGMIYACRTNGTFIALNRVGREVWRIDLGSPLAAPAIVGRDGRLLLFTTGRIVCVTASGTILWKRNLESPPAFVPKITAGGYFLAFLENGELIEASPFGRIRNMKFSRALADILPLPDGSLLALAEGGQAELVPGFGFEGPSWPFPPLESPPILAAGRGGNAALVLANGKIALLSCGGEGGPGLRWIRDAGLPPSLGREDVEVALDDRGIHVLGRSAITVYDIDGAETRKFRYPSALASVPALSEKGVIYGGGTDWILYAWQFEDASREPAPDRIIYRDAYGTADPRYELLEEYRYGFTLGAINHALADIRRNIETGAIGNAEWLYLGYLMEVITNLGRDGASARMNLDFYDPVLLTQRTGALELLGYLGSRETVPFLLDLYARHPEPVIKAAAAEAIGRIGADPGGEALRAFANLIYGPVSYRDERVLLATAAATGALCRFQGPPLTTAGIRLLTALETRDRPQRVRRQATKELDTLRSYE